MKTKYYKIYICIIYFILFSCNNYSNNAYRMLIKVPSFDPIFDDTYENPLYQVYFKDKDKDVFDVNRSIKMAGCFSYFNLPSGFIFYSTEDLEPLFINMYTQRKI